MLKRVGGVRGVAIGLVGLLLAVALASAAVPAFNVCRQKTAETGDVGVVTVCEPYLSEVAVLGLAVLFIALILLPIISEFDVAGLVSIKTKAEKAEKDAAEAKDLAEELSKVQQDLRDIQDRLLAQSLVQSSAEEFARQLRETRVAYAAAAGMTDAERQAEDARRGLLIEGLLANWAGLERRGLTGPRSSDDIPFGVLAALQGQQLEDSAAFEERFRLSIEQVRAVRNRVAHGGTVDTRELERAVELSASLLDEWDATFGAPRQ